MMPGRWAFESSSAGLGSTTVEEATLSTRPKPRSRMPPTTASDQLHWRQYELAIGRLPLLAREGERLDRRWPARVGHENRQRAEVGLDALHQRGDAVEVEAVVDVGVAAQLGGRRLEALARPGAHPTEAPSAASSRAIASPIP